MPLAFTTLAGTKFVPVSARVNAPVPATTDVGLMLDSVGDGLVLMVNAKPLDVPPPGDGLTTLTVAVPTAVISDAGTVAVSEVDDTKVVARFAPFQVTTDVDTKFVPVTVSMKAGPL